MTSPPARRSTSRADAPPPFGIMHSQRTDGGYSSRNEEPRCAGLPAVTVSNEPHRVSDPGGRRVEAFWQHCDNTICDARG